MPQSDELKSTHDRCDCGGPLQFDDAEGSPIAQTTEQRTDVEREWACEDRALEVVKAAFGEFSNPSEAYLLWQRKNPMIVRGLLKSIASALQEVERTDQ